MVCDAGPGLIPSVLGWAVTLLYLWNVLEHALQMALAIASFLHVAEVALWVSPRWDTAAGLAGSSPAHPQV